MQHWGSGGRGVQHTHPRAAAANHSQMVPMGRPVSGCLARRGPTFDPPAALAGDLSRGKTGSALGCTQRKRRNLTEKPCGVPWYKKKQKKTKNWRKQSGFSCGLAGSHPVSPTRTSHATGIVMGEVSTSIAPYIIL